MKVKIPYASWYGDYDVSLDFPDEWKVIVAKPRDAKPLGKEEIMYAFRNPIGTKRISDLAKNRKDAVLIIDDISRPTPASRLIPYIIEDLEAGGFR